MRTIERTEQPSMSAEITWAWTEVPESPQRINSEEHRARLAIRQGQVGCEMPIRRSQWNWSSEWLSSVSAALEPYGALFKARVDALDAQPEKRKYPMPDASHARNAKARASEMEHQGKLSAADKKRIDAKADRILKK
jgi:hypothetical protein